MPTPSERRVLLVVVATAAVSAATLVVLLSRAAGIGRDEVVLAVGLACAAIAARHFPLQIAFRRRMVTDGAPLFAALLLLPPWLAAIVALVGVGVAEVLVGTGKRDLRQVTFNACQAFLGIAAGAAVYAVVASASLPSSDASVMWAALLAGMTLIVVGDALVFLVVWAQLGIRFRRMAADWAKNRSDLPYDAALLVAGFLAALAGSIHAWLLALLAVPTPVLYRAMRNQMALRLQTREAVEALADIVDERDPYTFGHCKRVAEYAAALCRQMGFSPDLTDEIVLAARVHDVGKIGIRDSVLLKPDRLSADEYDHIKLHPDIGARLTARFPDFRAGTRYIRHHHERFDGTGYPLGLAGNDIPLGARIIAVADTYDAMTSTRVYRPEMDEDVARDEMAAATGTQLDPEVVAAWFEFKGWAVGREERARRAA